MVLPVNQRDVNRFISQRFCCIEATEASANNYHSFPVLCVTHDIDRISPGAVADNLHRANLRFSR
jgi:hypothetical protein